MNIHEYQGKQIYARYGVPHPKGIPAFSAEEARKAAETLIAETGNEVVVVKAQIHAGGRGKAGGVKVAKGAAAAEEKAKALLGTTLVTKQTGPEGKKVNRLYIEQGLNLEGARELYFSMLIDRETRRVTAIASAAGGVDIEEVAETHPEKILKVVLDPAVGFAAHYARQLGFGLELKGTAMSEFVSLCSKLYDLFLEEDCSMLEVNPLVITGDNHVICLDAKVNFDENASFRHPEWDALRDPEEEEPTETEAKEAGLSYVKLDGNIGCLVNGAGLAMSTMDIIQHYGGSPANFLDVGGGATKDQVTKAFRIILTDPNVKGIFVNIFGGIMKCDTIAEGVIAAAKELGLKVPVVCRLEGTNVEKGREILANSGIAVMPAANMAEGAQKIVELAKSGAAKG
ncbi:MAG: ADP-forming succinate--CoA ligase subunit beta [Deltaproteobacteria bacterium]|nr:ADP-forming succinate--CoA ligase subunit beta [Deltaproteobacteria bacterium]